MTYTPRPDVIWSKLQELVQMVRQLMTQAPLGYSSITEGSLRVASNEGLHVEGSAKVSGWLVVTGILRLVGTLQMLGTMLVEGVINLTGEIIVAAGGKITVGGMVIDPSGGGSVTFPGGAVVQAGPGGGIEMRHGDYAATVTSQGASIGRNGQSLAITDAVGFQAVGIPTAAKTGVPSACVWVDNNRRLFVAP